MIYEFVKLLDNAALAVLIAALLGFRFYARQKKIDTKFKNQSKLIDTTSKLLKECQNVLFVINRINYTTKFYQENKSIRETTPFQEFSEMIKSEMPDLSKYINDAVPRAAMDVENICEIHFPHNKKVKAKLSLMQHELKKWHDNLLNSKETFNFSGKKAEEIFPIKELVHSIRVFITTVSET